MNLTQFIHFIILLALVEHTVSTKLTTIENGQMGKTHIRGGLDWEVTNGLLAFEKFSKTNSFQITALPLGNGDSTIVQCPNGDYVLIDMGQSGSLGWNPKMVKSYLRNIIPNITTIVISHADSSHYNFIPYVFDANNSKALDRIILAGYKDDYTDTEFKYWLNYRSDMVEFVNNQQACISDCKTMPPFCKGTSQVWFQYLGANLGNNVYGRSVILSIQSKYFNMFLPGDFEGNDIESLLVDEWSRIGLKINATHMKLSRHGSATYSNSQTLISAIRPNVALVSNEYPSSPNFNPSCDVVGRLLETGSIEKRYKSMSFACGNIENSRISQYSNWPYEIYTTSPEKYNWQIVSFDVPLYV